MTTASIQPPSATVVIPTYNRPQYLRDCVAHLARQTVAPTAVVVVDASPDSRTHDLLRAEFPDVEYLRNDRGPGTTATSRNIGLGRVTTDITAFVDDDANARADWLEQLLAPYADPRVGGVGGRVRNGTRDETHVGDGQIGGFLPNGTLTGNFAADPGRVIAVDHLLGASMSFRTSILRQNGGIHDRYPGTCMREETDIALRVSRAGWRLAFTPFAVVEHVEGPYASGRRFDLRYRYYSHRNHLVLLNEIVGLGARQTRAYVEHCLDGAAREIVRGARTARTDRHARPAVVGLARAGVIVGGLAGGVGAVARARFEQLRPAARGDAGEVAGTRGDH